MRKEEEDQKVEFIASPNEIMTRHLGLLYTALLSVSLMVHEELCLEASSIIAIVLCERPESGGKQHMEPIFVSFWKRKEQKSHHSYS